MDCRTCQPTLIDLVHDELATDAAAAAHEHMATCDSCRGAFKRLQAGLQLAQELEPLRPPQRVEARLLQLAEVRAHELAAARMPAEPQAPSPLQTLVEFIGRFAMGRQVGMATITLLIVGLGLWSLPQLSRSPTVTGHSVVNPDTSAEAAPSSGMQPAAPLDLKVDLRARRIRSKEEQADQAQQGLPAVVPEPAPPPAAEPASNAPADPARALDDIDAPLEAFAEVGGLSAAEGNAGPRAAGDEAKQAEARPRGAPEAFPQSPSATTAPTAERLAASAPAKHRDKAAESDDLLDGTTKGGSLGRATTSSRSEAEAVPERAKKSNDPCASAEARYAALAQKDAGGAQTGQALLALARCREDAGQTATARTLLQRATRNAAVASEAWQRLSADEPAARPAAKPAAPAQTASEPSNAYKR